MEERLREEIKNQSVSNVQQSSNNNTTFLTKPSCSTLNRINSNDRSLKEGVIPIVEEVTSSRKKLRQRSESGD